MSIGLGSHLLVRSVRVEAGAVPAGILLALHDVLCARGAHESRRTRALVRVTKGLALGAIATRHGGAVILQFAVVTGVARGAGAGVAVQTP